MKMLTAAVVGLSALSVNAAGAKRIDFENHYISTNYFNYVATRTEVPKFDTGTMMLTTWAGDVACYKYPMCSTNTLYTDVTDLGDKRLAEMDRAGIDVAVLSSSMQVDDLPGDKALEIAKASNDDIYNATQAHPARFMGAALLPMLQVDAATNELERCVHELNFRYWHAYSTVMDADAKPHYIWEPEFEPLLAKAEELNVCIYIHPESPADGDYWDMGGVYAGPGMAYGQDVMQTATHLVMNGTFDKHPNLRVILGHMGEYLPYILDRMNYHQTFYLAGAPNADPTNMQCKETLYHYVVTNANFVITTSGATDTNAFLCAKEALGADRIVFASDWPYENYTNATKFIDTCELTDAEKDGVWSDNAAMYILHTTVPVPEDILSIDHVTYSLWQRDTDKDEWREMKFNTVSNCYNVLYRAGAKIVYQAEPGYHFADNSLSVTRTLNTRYLPVSIKSGQDPLPEVVKGSRAPDYAEETGHDWLFNHDIEGKRYEGEPTEDPGVDLFYLYPTAVTETNDNAVDNICDIDDETLRGENGALGAWKMSGEAFGDYTRVYAPYYRQTPADFEVKFVHEGEYGVTNANDRIVEYWYEHAPYADVTNALTHYFTVINPDQGGGERRPFILAGHSHGSGMLRLAMERFFTNTVQKAWLKNMVACYAVGFGVGKDVEETIKDKAGVYFATNATDTGVYVMWNTQGAGVKNGEPAALWPANAAASVNPITWTREADAYAAAAKNLGAFAAADTGAIRPGLYDASNLVANGTIVCSSPDVADKYMSASWGFGENSLHSWDYKLYWDSIHANGLQRIRTWKEAYDVPVNTQLPLVGQPIDYADASNWVTNSIAATGVTRDVDALFFYPTVEMEGDSTFVPVTDAHKAKAYDWCADKVTAFGDYANILMPAYRQMNMASVTAGQTLYPSGDEFFDFLRPTVSRTDLFAALDYYFTTINPNGTRPFFFAGHSQGSTQIKILLQDYFTRDANRAKLNNLIAAYALGYSFDAKWIVDLGLGLNAAEGAAETKAVISWNTEGTNAVEHSFVVEDGAIAINPMTWTTTKDVWSGTTPDAMIQQRAGYADGTYVLVTTNATDYVPESMAMGDRSLHTQDWSLWLDPIRANGWTRYWSVSGLAKVETDAVPSVADATWKVEVKGEGEAWNEAVKSPVDGFYYVFSAAAADTVRLTCSLSGEATSRRFVSGETTISFPMAYDAVKGTWSTTASASEIASATKTDTPKVQLGVVAQRYPWNGILDVNYKTTYTPVDQYTLKLKVEVEGAEKEATCTAASGVGSTTVDLREAFGEVKGKAKVTATLDNDYSDECEVAIDTRERIVVGDPGEVLPIAYSTNYWGGVVTGCYVEVVSETLGFKARLDDNGYLDEFPIELGRFGQYGAYQVEMTLFNGNHEPYAETVTNTTIYYSAPYTLTINEPEGGTIAVTTNGAAVASGDSVLGYELLNLAATPVPLTNDARYEFAGWNITTNGAAVAGATALPAVAEFEMPNADTVLAASFQWKSNFTETVTVETDYTWEALAGDDYQDGLYNEGTVVWKPGQTNAVGRAYGLEDIGQLHNGLNGKLQIVFDETLTNTTYKLGTGYTAIGMTFEITDGANTGNCTVVWEDDYATADWTYVGAKRFKLWVEGDHSDLLLVVEDGKFQVTYDAMGGAWDDGAEASNIVCYVKDGYTFPAADPMRNGYAFAGWYTNATCAVAAVAAGDALAEMADHTLYADWVKGFGFVETACAVAEGGTAVVTVNGGSPDRATQVTLTYVRGTGAFSAAYMGGKRVTLPLVLTWAKGDTSAREIAFVTTANRAAAGDTFFTLQLGSEVGMDLLAGKGLCTVTIRDAQGGAEAVPYVRALAWPANGGKVTGANYLRNERSKVNLVATANRWATFAGWYAAKADDAEAIDLTQPIDPTNEKQPTRLTVGYGTDLAAGTYYAYFTNVMDVAAVVEPTPFDTETGAALPGVAGVTGWDAKGGTCATMVGVKFALPIGLEAFGDAKATLTAKGLPAGINLSKDKSTGAYAIGGVPTRAGTFAVTLTAKNQAGASAVTYTLAVAALPANAVGTFYGVVRDEEGRPGVGSVTFTAGKTGALSAKVTRREAGTRSFSAKGYDYLDADTLGVAATNTCGEVVEAVLPLTGDVFTTALAGTAFGGEKKGTLGYYGETNGTFAAYRNAAKAGDAAAKQVAYAYAGTYTDALYDALTGESVGTVSFRVSANGGVSVVAKYAKTVDPVTGKAVSAKTLTGSGDGAFVYDGDAALGTAQLCLRSGTSTFGADVRLDMNARGAEGDARYVRPSTDKTTVLDEIESVGAPDIE